MLPVANIIWCLPCPSWHFTRASVLHPRSEPGESGGSLLSNFVSPHHQAQCLIHRGSQNTFVSTPLWLPFCLRSSIQQITVNPVAQKEKLLMTFMSSTRCQVSAPLSGERKMVKTQLWPLRAQVSWRGQRSKSRLTSQVGKCHVGRPAVYLVGFRTVLLVLFARVLQNQFSFPQTEKIWNKCWQGMRPFRIPDKMQ